MGAERIELQIVGHLSFSDQIAAADFNAVDVDFGGDRIHEPLARKRRFVAARCAISPAGRLVGEANVSDGAIGRHAIGSRQHGGGEIGHGCRMRAHIGAVVVEEFIVDGEDVAFGIDCRANAVRLLTRMVGGD